MSKKLHTSLSIIYIFAFVTLWIAAPLQITSTPGPASTTVFAQSDACPIPNSHQVGDQCVCNDFYKASGGECAPMTADEICPTANSHQVGSECVCDSYYQPSGGQCEPMGDSEVCPVANTHRVGDECFCNEGYLSIGGKCVDPDAYCAAHHATYSASIQDCSCITGYTENAAKDDCIPVTVQEKETVPPPSPSSPPQATTSPPQGETPPEDLGTISLIPIDPVKTILDLKSGSSTDISNSPILDASIKGLSASEVSSIEDQKEAIKSMFNPDNDSVELLPTDDQQMSLIRNVVTQQVAEDEKNWNQAVEQAEKTGKIKNESDKQAFVVLQQHEATLIEQIKNNQVALEVMHKQNVQFMLNENSFASSMFLSDKQFQNTPKRDFVKESNGDVTEAMVRATQAISAQYNLIRGIKEELRKVKEDKLKLLDVPPKPDLQKELDQVKVDWYKQKN